MKHENISINQPTRYVLLRTQEAQSIICKFSQLVLGGNASKEQSLELLGNATEILNAVRRAIEGEGRAELRACSVMSYSGEASAEPPPV